MSFLENLEENIFEDEAGNGFIIQDELPFDDGIQTYNLTKQKLEDPNLIERLKYMEDYGI
jgi:hypothetical protein